MTKSKNSRARRIGLPVALAAVAMSGAVALTTGALFTDSATVTGNTFTTGTVDINATPAAAAVSLTTMAPGDVVTGEITVTNGGSLAERYSMESVIDANNLPGLTMQVKTGVTTCTTAGFAATGLSAYGPGALGGLAASPQKVIGDKATGSQTGDRVLAAGASEKLCVQVALPLSADNTNQGKTTTATFNFNSEQTANN